MPPSETLESILKLYNPDPNFLLFEQAISPSTPPTATLITPAAVVSSEFISPRQIPSKNLPPLFTEDNTTAPSDSQLSSSHSPVVTRPTLSIIPGFAQEDNQSESEDEDMDEYRPMPRRMSTNKKSTRAQKSRPRAAAPAPARARISHDLPMPEDHSVSPQSSTPLPGNPRVHRRPVAPDAEANSDYQGSDSGGDQSIDLGQSSFSGGPQRGGRPNGSSRRGSGGGGHPYKSLKEKSALGTGRQVCTYVSPYDGWKCEQILGRSYDVPRHMEVHAKEEYELVLTGKLRSEDSDLFECVTEANVYVCLVCRKEFSRKDAMQRHVRNSAKTSKLKHRAEGKVSIKKRVLGTPLQPHPNNVPINILEKHKEILEKLKIEAQGLGQDVTDWDVEQMIPKIGEDTVDSVGTPANAPGIPVGRRGNKPKLEEPTSPLSRSTRSSLRVANAVVASQESVSVSTPEESRPVKKKSRTYTPKEEDLSGEYRTRTRANNKKSTNVTINGNNPNSDSDESMDEDEEVDAQDEDDDEDRSFEEEDEMDLD